MKNKFLALVALLPLACVAQPRVRVAGALSNIMKMGDMSTHLRLDTINKEGLYGLGPVAGLKGELIVVDGMVYVSEKSGDTLISHQRPVDAAMFVFSYVPKWKEIKLTKPVKSYSDLEKQVEEAARKHGISSTVPFAFRIKASGSLDFHVVDWNEGEVHTMENHKQFAFKGTMQSEAVEMLGFYSDHHHSIFTHHSSNMHLHILSQNKVVGHLDAISNLRDISLFIPAEQ